MVWTELWSVLNCDLSCELDRRTGLSCGLDELCDLSSVPVADNFLN